MSCEQGHHLDYLTDRCTVCGKSAEQIVMGMAKRELRDAKAARPANKRSVRLKGIVGGR